MTCVFCNLNKDKQTPIYKELNLQLDKNYLIKGDNLDVLHSMLDTHMEKIKLIYIDPPYNTKSKKQYKDRFTHLEWLDFMHPRLVLARELLRDDGIIFISIDDNEVAQLKILMDSIFGSDNFISQAVWEKRYANQNTEKYISINHEYILIYKKSSDLEKLNGLPRTTKQNKMYKNHDNDPRGVWASDNFSVMGNGNKYEIINPAGKKCIPPSGRGWRYSEKRYKELLADNRIWFGKNGSNIPSYKRFLNEVQDYLVCPSIWQATNNNKEILIQLEKLQKILDKENENDISNIIKKIKKIELERSSSVVGHTDEYSKELIKLFNGEKVFDFPKGTRLIKHMLQIATCSEDDDIILDFFAGSGTLGHAVLEKNLEDNGSRKYILIQNDELSTHEDYETIFDVCNERMRLAYKKNNVDIDYEVVDEM